MMFDREPVGAEDCIRWHLEQVDYHAEQEVRDPDFAHKTHHDKMGRAHGERLAELKEDFPETYRAASADRLLQEAQIKKETRKFEHEPIKPSDAFVWHLDSIRFYRTLESSRSKSSAKEQIARHNARLDDLERQFPAASVNARGRLLMTDQNGDERHLNIRAFSDSIKRDYQDASFICHDPLLAEKITATGRQILQRMLYEYMVIQTNLEPLSPIRDDFNNLYRYRMVIIRSEP